MIREQSVPRVSESGPGGAHTLTDKPPSQRQDLRENEPPLPQARQAPSLQRMTNALGSADGQAPSAKLSEGQLSLFLETTRRLARACNRNMVQDD